MPRPHREAFLGSQCLLPELTMLAQSHSQQARVPGLKAHSHFHIFEIFYLERGEVEWWTNDEAYRVKAGHIYINRPGEQHGSVGNALQPCSYCWFQLREVDSRFLPGLPIGEARSIYRILQEVSPRCFPVSQEIERHFQSMLSEAREPGPMSMVVMRAHLHLLLAQITRDVGRQTPQHYSPAVRGALRYVASNLENDLSPALLAAQAGLSLGHFRERFRAETGFTPHAYVIRQRVNAARSLLTEGSYSVADVSRRYGFCSSQHFATVFKKLEGVCPSHVSESAANITTNQP